MKRHTLAAAILFGLLGSAALDAHAQKRKEAVAPAQVSCTSGPYRLHLPKTYRGLRTMGQLRRERVLKTEDGKTLRELRFNGLELEVLTSASEYTVSKAIVSTRNWRIAGPLRVGTPARSALKALQPRSVPSDGEIEFNGDADSIRVNLSRGRILDFEYTCSAE